MTREGQVALFNFPRTDGSTNTLRPALVVRSLPGPHNDWLVCMISTQLRHEIPELDEVVSNDDPEFGQTGLKATSLIRASRLAVVSESVLQGSIGTISNERLDHIRSRLADWITS